MSAFPRAPIPKPEGLKITKTWDLTLLEDRGLKSKSLYLERRVLLCRSSFWEAHSPWLVAP